MKRAVFISTIVLLGGAAVAINVQSSESSLASEANISSHAPHGHASSNYVCGELDLKIIYNLDVPVVEFQGKSMPITRTKNAKAEQYSSTLDGQDVLLTILDHAVDLKIGDKTYKACEKISCVPLPPH